MESDNPPEHPWSAVVGIWILVAVAFGIYFSLDGCGGKREEKEKSDTSKKETQLVPFDKPAAEEKVPPKAFQISEVATKGIILTMKDYGALDALIKVSEDGKAVDLIIEVESETPEKKALEMCDNFLRQVATLSNDENPKAWLGPGFFTHTVEALTPDKKVLMRGTKAKGEHYITWSWLNTGDVNVPVTPVDPFEVTRRLYLDLQRFKNEEKFHRLGFTLSEPKTKYRLWYESLDRVKKIARYNSQLVTKGITLEDLDNLGEEYLKNRGQPTQFSEFITGEFKRALKLK
jgi:hypothetical protein